jgi:hypothetical protein
VRFHVLFSNITATSIVAIALTALLLSSSPLPSSFSFHSNTNRDLLAFASPSISGSQTTVQEPPPSLPPSPPSPAYPPLGNESTQSSQSQSGEGSGPSPDNFNLPAGYIIEPVLENLSMPTSIALDSENGTIYVAESINEYDNNDNSSGILTSSSPHPGSFLSQQPQVRIVKADDISGVDNNDTIVNQTLDHGGVGINGDDDDDNISTIVNTDLKWPVIDMEVDDASGLLYALHDHTTIWKINTTSGQREDILVPGEEPAGTAGSYEYEEEQQDPLSFIINSSSQIALSGKQDYHNGSEDVEQPGSNSYTTVLYVPCMNGHVDNNNNYSTYCILGLPIDRSGNSAIIDNLGSVNSSSSSFILENMTSRPVGIAIFNSSSNAATSSSSSSTTSPYSSSPSTSGVSDEQSPYALTGSQIPSTLFNNSENDLLIVASQPTNNRSSFGNTNDDNYSKQNHSYGSSGSSGGSYSSTSSGDDPLSSLNTIYHAKVFDSIPYPGNSNNNNSLQDTIDNLINDNTNYGDSSNNYTHRQQAQPPSMEALSDYPYGQLGQVAVVSVPSTTTTATTTSSSSPSSSFVNETTQTNQTPSTEEGNFSALYPLSFGLNKTTAFIADFGNSSASGAASALNLPKIMMLDVQTGNITPFLALKHSDPNFTPIDIVFDYNSSALYVLSTGNNQEDNANNNNNATTTTSPTNNTNDLPNTGSLNNKSSGVIWKISYQGEEQEAASDSNSSSISNSTDNNNNDSDDATSNVTSPTPSSSSNDTDSFDNITDSDAEDNNGLDDESFYYDEDEDDTDDDNIGTDDNSSISSSSSSEVDTEDNGEGSASSSPPPSDSSSQDTTTPPDDSSTTPPDEQSPPSTTPPPPPSKDPENEAPVANDQRIEIEEDAPSVDIELTATDNNYEDIQNLEFTIVSDPTHGMLGGIRQQEGSSGDRGSDNSQVAKATVTYTPDENYNGQDTFQFKVNDGHNNKADSNAAAATVTINITPVNDAPTAEDDTATTDQGTAVLIDVLANDADIDEQSNNGDDSFTIDSVDKQSTQGGSIARVNTGSGDNNDNTGDDSGRGTHNEKIEYTPAEGFSGTDKFTYTIIDSNGATESATVTVTVKAAVSETEELPTGALEDGEGKSDSDNSDND